MKKIAIIDYGIGNLHSVAKAIEHVAPDRRVLLTIDEKELRNADRIIFPGQGTIGSAIADLKQYNLLEALPEIIKTKPFLGICLGLQILMTYSNENNGVKGLGVIPGLVEKLPIKKLPNIGWFAVDQKEHKLWNGIKQNSKFFFAHSYYATPDNVNDITGTTSYNYPFTCAIAHENIFAVQFHPEKSLANGLRLLQNFIEWEI